MINTMVVTPAQLKNNLVSYYVSSWLSNGVTVSWQDMIGQVFEFNPDPNGTVEAIKVCSPYETYLSLGQSNSYLRVCCDDSAPADPHMRARYIDLENFMSKNPSVVRDMCNLLDNDINRYGLADWYQTKPVACMNAGEKVC